MTTTEKTELIIALRNEILAQESIIADSDRHACKCAKLGLVFKEEYPEEYQKYNDAITAYHAAEDRLAEVEVTEPEDIMPVPEEQ